MNATLVFEHDCGYKTLDVKLEAESGVVSLSEDSIDQHGNSDRHVHEYILLSLPGIHGVMAFDVFKINSNQYQLKYHIDFSVLNNLIERAKRDALCAKEFHF